MSKSPYSRPGWLTQAGNTLKRYEGLLVNLRGNI